MKTAKRLFGRICSIMIALVLILTAIPTNEMTVYAAETTEATELTNAVEKAIATNIAKDLYSSSYTGGSSLSSGVYYLSADKTFGSTSSGSNGLKIASNATVYIYIPAGVTLTAIGRNGSGTTGGYAGILVPSGSKLIFLGDGTVVAKGGKAGDASVGGAGTGFSYSTSGSELLYVPAGGTGGAGGGGAGAGIGTNGGSGGSGAGSGGSGRWVDKDEGYNGYTGSNGNSGSNAYSTGAIYNTGVTINATGGASGNYGGGGSAGSSGYVTFSGSDTRRGAAGGAGGGGGGSGKAGAAIGTGGGGGGQGGGGGSAGYIWSGYYIGGGGGGAGAGATSGNGGSRGSFSLFYSIDREKKIETEGADGSSSSTTPGRGTTGYIKNKDKDVTTRATGGSGGYGGSAGASFSTTTVQTSNIPTFSFTVTFEGAKTTDNLNVQTYNYGTTGTILVPEYDGDASTCFLGWEVKTYGKYASSGVMLSETDTTIYQPGETIIIEPGFSGSVVLVARTVALQGVSAKTETLVIEAEDMDTEVSYYTYQVNAYLDDVISDVGNLELRDELGNVYEISFEDGVYSFITDLDTEFSIYRNNTDTGMTVTKDEVTEFKLYTASITTKLDGEESAEMGVVSLKGEGAPVLSTFPNSGIYTAINQKNNIYYKVFVDGINTNCTVTYGQSLVLNYYTTTLFVTGNLKPENVLLVANDGSCKVELYETAENEYSAVKLKHDLIYTMYIDGQKTKFTNICFNQTNELSVNYNKTTITTTLDGVVKEVGVITLEQSNTVKEDDGVNSSTDITYSDDSLEGTVSVNDREVGKVVLGSNSTISYYSVEYISGHKILGKIPTDTTIYLKGDQVLLAPAVTSEDIAYEFAGWYVDGVLYQPGDIVTVTDKKVIVTAAWEDKEFEIKYEMNLENAVNAPTNPNSYTISGGNVQIENPIADGYIFEGWTYEGVYEPKKDLVILADSRLHFELVANWTPKVYQIESDVEDASDNQDGIISLNFGARITGYADSLVPKEQLITITNTGNQSISLNVPVFKGTGNDYFIITSIGKNVLAPYESTTFTVQPKTGLETGIYEDVIEVSCVSTENPLIEGNCLMLTTRFEVGRDVTAPEVTVTVENGDVVHTSNQFIFEPEEINWKLYSTKPEITIDAIDLESGVSKVEYYLTKKPMTFTESGGLDSVTSWKVYNENRKPTISDSGTGTYYLFVRVTDMDGNVSYVSTEGLVVDIIAPSISFADGTVPEMYETYVGTQNVVIKDNHLVSVTVDGVEIMGTADSIFEFELIPSMGTEQVIVATDSFGHSTEIIFIVEPKEYTIHADLNGGEGSIDDWNVYEAETNILPLLPDGCEAPYGKELAGWAIGSVDSDIVIAPRAEYKFDGNTTIYAIWKNITYTIDYELNGGVNAEGNPTTFDKDTSAIILLNPTKERFIFVGWTWEAGMGIGTQAQDTPVKDVVIEKGTIQNKCFIANWEKMTEVIDQMLTDVPELNDVNTGDKELISEVLDIVNDLLSEDNIGSLTDAEIIDIKEKKEQLEELLEKIKAAEEKMEAVEETVTNLPDADEVTSEDKEKIEDTLDIIEDLLSEENVGNLTEEEKTAMENEKADLTEKLEEIQKLEETLVELQNRNDSIPSKEVITTEYKDEISELIGIITDLQENHLNNLTEEQHDVITQLKEELQKQYDKIEEIENILNEIEDKSDAQPDYDNITSNNKDDIEDIIKNIENILKDEKENLSNEEVKALEEQKKELEDKVTFIEKIENYEPVSEDYKNTTEPENNDFNGDLDDNSQELFDKIPLEKFEKEHVAKGENVNVYLEVTDITETIPREEKKLIGTIIQDKDVAVYLDVTLFKKIGNREPKKVPNTNGLVTITFKVPNDMVNTDKSVIRKYHIVCVHEGNVSVIDTVYNKATGTVSFETDKFSTYALVYEDIAVENPKTGDVTPSWPWMLLVISVGMLAFSVKAGSMYEVKKK
ncbi:MAG: InlB B-repeat-containing protein [Lachnospiraceae bacterium]|nr:InlB B-repeat-containing protein [Lachnospiraceae bacterium]